MSTVSNADAKHVEQKKRDLSEEKRALIHRLSTPRLYRRTGEVIVGKGAYSFVTTTNHSTVKKYMLAEDTAWVTELLSLIRLKDVEGVLRPQGLSLVRRELPLGMMHEFGRGMRTYACIEYKMYLPLQFKTLTLRAARAIFGRLYATIVAMHCNGVCHRDIKPSNILIGSGEGDYKPILCDFSSAALCSKMSEVSTTIHYRAPEVKSQEYDCRIDYFGLGMVYFAMLAHEEFWYLLFRMRGIEYTDAECLALLWSHEYYKLLPLLISRFDREDQEILMILLHPSPDKRGRLVEVTPPKYIPYVAFMDLVGEDGARYSDISTKNLVDYAVKLCLDLVGNETLLDLRTFIDSYRETVQILERNDGETLGALYVLFLTAFTDGWYRVKNVVNALESPHYQVSLEGMIQMIAKIFLAYGQHIWELIRPDYTADQAGSSPIMFNDVSDDEGSGELRRDVSLSENHDRIANTTVKLVRQRTGEVPSYERNGIVDVEPIEHIEENPLAHSKQSEEKQDIEISEGKNGQSDVDEHESHRELSETGTQTDIVEPIDANKEPEGSGGSTPGTFCCEVQ